MVLWGSFLEGGWGDGEGGRTKNGTGEEDGFHPRCAGVHTSSPTSRLVPAGPGCLELATATQDQGSGTTVQWNHSAVVPVFTTGWAGDMFLHPATHLSAQSALSLPPLAPSSMALPDL